MLTLPALLPPGGDALPVPPPLLSPQVPPPLVLLPAPADTVPAPSDFADLIAQTVGEDAPAPDTMMPDTPPAQPASLQPWAFVLVPELAHLPAPVVDTPAKGTLAGDVAGPTSSLAASLAGKAPWPLRAAPGFMPVSASAAPARTANWQATLPGVAAPEGPAPVALSPPLAVSTADQSPSFDPVPPQPIPVLPDAPAAMVSLPPPVVDAGQQMPANAPIPAPAPRRDDVSENSIFADADPAIAAPAQPVAAQAAPMAARATAPQPFQTPSQTPPETPREPAAGPAIAIASERLGEVAVRLNGSAENLQVSLQAQPAAAVLIGAESQRLQQDMANAGVSMSALSINGQRADLGNGQQGRQPPQPRRETVIAAARPAAARTTPTADRFA